MPKKPKTPTYGRGNAAGQSLEDRIDRPVRASCSSIEDRLRTTSAASGAGWATLSSGGRVKRPLPGCP